MKMSTNPKLVSEEKREKEGLPEKIETTRPEGKEKEGELEGIAQLRPESSASDSTEASTGLRRSKRVAERSPARKLEVVSVVTTGPELKCLLERLERHKDRESNTVTMKRMSRNSSASTLDGSYSTTGTPKTKRKELARVEDSGETSPVSSIPGTSGAGKKRKKTSPKKGEEAGDTRLVRPKLVPRSAKTPRASDAESAGEGAMLPPPSPSPATPRNLFEEKAPEGKEISPKEPKEDKVLEGHATASMDEILLVVDLVSPNVTPKGSSAEEDDEDEKAVDDAAEDRSSSMGSLGFIGADRGTAKRL